MAEPDIIVIDDSDSSDGETTEDGGARSSSASEAPPPAKRARLDGRQTTTSASVPASETASSLSTTAARSTGSDTAVITPATRASNTPNTLSAASNARSGKAKDPPANLNAKNLNDTLANAVQPSTKITQPRETICDILRRSHTPAPYSTGGGRSLGYPGLCVDGLPEAYVSFPVLPAQAAALAACGVAHPVSDAPLRQWLPDQFSFRNPKFATMLGDLCRAACESVGVDRDKLRCVPYKLLLHGCGGKTLRLNNANVPGMVASMIVLLPSQYTGGSIAVRYGKSSSTEYDFQGPNFHECAYFFNFGSGNETCAYDIEPILSGSRLMLIYNLIQTDSTIPRILYRDEARLLLEVKAASEVWDTAKEKPVVWMTELQYPCRTGARIDKSMLRGKDAKVIQLLERATGADLEWDLASVDYVVHGKGKEAYSGGGISRKKVWDSKTHDEMTLALNRFGKIRYSREAEAMICPRSYFESVVPADTTFESRYRYYDDNDITARKTYASKTCIFIWPRSQTYETMVDKATGICGSEMSDRVIRYVEETSRTCLTPAQHAAAEQFKKLTRTILDGKSGYSCSNSAIAALSKLIVRLNDSDAAQTFLGYLRSCPESFKTEFVRTALPSLVQHFGSSLSAKLAPLVKSVPIELASSIVLNVMAMPSDSNNPTEGSTELSSEMLLAFSERVIGACNKSSASHEVRQFARTLGCDPDNYSYRSPEPQWPNKGVGKILVYLCDHYSKGSDTGNATVTADIITGFIGAIGRALASNTMSSQVRIDSMFDKLFSVADLSSVGRALFESKPDRASLVSGFVNKLPFELRADMVLKAIEESKEESPNPKNAQHSTKIESAAVRFALSLVRGSDKGMQATSKELTFRFIRRIIGDGSDTHHKKVAKSLKHFPHDGIETILCVLCDLPPRESASTGRDEKGPTCTAEDITKFLCALGCAFVLIQASSDDDKDIFDRMFTTRSLTSVVKRCGDTTLSQCMGALVGKLDYGAAATFVLSLCELGKTVETPAEAQANPPRANLGALPGNMLRLFSKRVCDESKDLTSSLARRNRDDPDSSTSSWPSNSIGLILRHLCKSSIRVTTTANNDTDTQGIAKFMTVTFRAIALDRSSLTVKTESSRCMCKRLLSKNDSAAAFEHCGVAVVTKCLEDVVEELPFGIAAEFILQMCEETDSGEPSVRATSSAAMLASMTADALQSFAALDEVHLVARKLLLELVRKRIVGDGSDGHFAKLAFSLGCGSMREPQTKRSSRLTRDVLHYLCEDGPAPGDNEGGIQLEVKSEDILGFVGAVCRTAKRRPASSSQSGNHGFHDNLFVKADFGAVIKRCGFDPIGQVMCPIIKELLPSGRISEVALLVNLLMSDGDSESQRQMCAPLAANAVGRVLASPLLADNRAVCTLLLLAAHFEETCNLVWDPAWKSNRPAQAKSVGVSEADTTATAQLAAFFEQLSLDRILSLLNEAETFLSLSGSASMKAATMKAAAILEQATRRSILLAEAKVNVGPTRPHSTWSISGPDSLYAYKSFLANPCETSHVSLLVQSRHRHVANEFREQLAAGVVSVTFFQHNGRGRYHIKITKKKQISVATLHVPQCGCQSYYKRTTCALWKYHRDMQESGPSMDKGVVEGLKDARIFFESLSKGLEPSPDVEIVAAPPAPEVEVVDLLD